MPQPPVERLGEILAEEARHFRRLLALLADQQDALRGADTDAVTTALHAQEAALAKIRVLESERVAVLETLAAPLALDPAALTMSRLLEAGPEAAAGLRAVRDELRALLGDVQRANERNLVLVTQGLGYLDRLLAHLASALAPEGAAAYSARGLTASAASSLGLVDRRA